MDLTATLTILLLLMGVNLLMYVKYRFWEIILVIYIFSLIFGMLALAEGSIPFTPLFQIFFLIFQSVIFILTASQKLQEG